jgi:hypothetical protein
MRRATSLLAIGFFALSTTAAGAEYLVNLRNPQDSLRSKATSRQAEVVVAVKDGIEVFAVGQIQLGPMKPAESLPLEVTITRFWPLTVSAHGELEVDLLIRNVGEVPVAIPVSTDEDIVFQTGNAQRMRLGLVLVVTLEPGFAASFQRDTGSIAPTYGSPSVEGSILVLQPGDSVRIETKGRLLSTQPSVDRRPDILPVTLRVSLQRDTLEESELKVAGSSEPITSRNAEQITLSTR